MKNLSAPAPNISPGDEFTWNNIECVVIVPYERSVLCMRKGSTTGKFGVPINDAIKAKIEKAYIDAGEKPPFIVFMKAGNAPCNMKKSSIIVDSYWTELKEPDTEKVSFEHSITFKPKL